MRRQRIKMPLTTGVRAIDINRPSRASLNSSTVDVFSREHEFDFDVRMTLRELCHRAR